MYVYENLKVLKFYYSFSPLKTMNYFITDRVRKPKEGISDEVSLVSSLCLLSKLLNYDFSPFGPSSFRRHLIAYIFSLSRLCLLDRTPNRHRTLFPHNVTF